MRIAVPVVGGRLSAHFGHCEAFALFDIDQSKNELIGRDVLGSPPHEPGALPAWLHEKGADVIIAGGMGRRAQNLFAQNGIRVVFGAAADEPERVVQTYLDGTLESGENICDH